jgi:sugar phosphate isomerase/epimerase
LLSIRVGLQLYSVRDQLQKDFIGTLTALARLGYPAVQFGGYGGLSARDLKQVIGDLGLAAAGSHVGFESLESNPDGEISYCLEIGTPEVIIPAMPAGYRDTAAGFQQFAEAMNRIGARCRELGARLSYHNHAFELVRFGDQAGLDLLLGACDPDLVAFEPDVYWLRYGGADPVAYIQKYAGRTPLIHLKDMTGGPTPTYAEVGEGIIDFAPIFAASEASGAEWYVVEQDYCARPALESVGLSLKHLRDWGKV